MPAKSLELKHTIKLIKKLDAEIDSSHSHNVAISHATKKLVRVMLQLEKT